MKQRKISDAPIIISQLVFLSVFPPLLLLCPLPLKTFVSFIGKMQENITVSLLFIYLDRIEPGETKKIQSNLTQFKLAQVLASFPVLSLRHKKLLSK